MRSAILSTYDIQGGAPRAAYRLHKGLLGLGVDSAVLSRHKKSPDPTVHHVRLPEDEGHRKIVDQLAEVQRRIVDSNRTTISNTFFSLPFPGYDLSVHPVVQRADILNLHWVTNLLCPAGIARLVAMGKPVVWTMHDQRAYTGGCHFTAGCSGYQETCSNCPQLAERSANAPQQVLADAARLIAPKDLTLVAPSRWTADCARRSSLFGHARIEHIPYGLELDLYRPQPRAAAKQALGISPQSVCFLFGADSCDEQRKGFRELRVALDLCLQKPAFQKRLAAGQVQFICFGYGSEKQTLPGLPLKTLGHLESDAALCQAYAAADVFLFASLEDNLPNTILEAMACGTAVIANPTGGVAELVEHEQTGFLARVTVPEDYAQAICFALEQPERIAAWQQNGLTLIRQRHSLELQARRYLSLFEELVGTAPKHESKSQRCLSETAPLLEESARFGRQRFLTPEVVNLERLWQSAEGSGYRPSWNRDNTFVNAEHERLGAAPGLPGAAAVALQKVYELGFYTGGVILEVGGTATHSRGVALRGANAAVRGFQPQCYRVTPDRQELQTSLKDIDPALSGQYLLFQGSLSRFLHDLPIVPTLVVVEAGLNDAQLRDAFLTLKNSLAPSTPILCTGYSTSAFMRQAVDQLLERHCFQAAGVFGDSLLLRAPEDSAATPRGLQAEEFASLRDKLLDRYTAARELPPGETVPVADLTAPFREPLLGCQSPPEERRPWPHSAASVPALPPTMPGGKPWPRISIVTPSFNQGQYLEETILSVLNQNYPNLEYIVMDGGSNDQSISILRRYESRLDFWASEKDRGQCHAINKGFARATGEILTWLNSDDLLAPGALAAVALGFHFSEAEMLAGVCQLYENGALLREHLTSCPDGPLPLDELLDQEHCWDKGQFFYQPEVFFTRALWQRAGAHLDESLYFSLDYELWLRFAQAGAILKVIGCPLAHYRVHPDQKTYTIERYRPELRQVRDRFLAGKPFAPSARIAARTLEHLRVVLANDVGPRFGAGIAHQRLGHALCQAGHEVLLLGISAEKVAGQSEADRLGQRLLERLHAENPDAVVLGNLHASRLGGQWVSQIAAQWPTVFMLHDCWLLTGRCTYMDGCDKYLSRCDSSCPTSNEYPALEPAEVQPFWESKQRLLAEAGGMVLAANSSWLKARAEEVLQALRDRGQMPRSTTCVVRYGLPLDVFRPRDRRICREILGLPQDKFVMLFCCANLADARKGAAHLVTALSQIDLPGLLPVCVGHGAEGLRYEVPDLVPMPYTPEPYRQALLYSAADLFVGPSLQEAFGQVFIEAAACGTPVVAYSVGGVPEAVFDGAGGRLAATTTPDALARAITELYYQPHLREHMRSWACTYARSLFSLQSSCRSLCAALRQALAARGIELAPTLRFVPRPLAPRVDYLVPTLLANGHPALPEGEVRSANSLFEAQMQDYFKHRLDAYRRSRWPWVLKPGAWLARLNRNQLRKAARRSNSGSGI